MQLLAALLVLDAVLHAAVIVKYGLKDKANTPFLVYAVIDTILALVIFLRLPLALWATMLLSAFGLLGLTVTFNRPARDKTLDKAIWVVDLAVVMAAGYFLFGR